MNRPDSSDDRARNRRLEQTRQLAWLLDDWFRIPFTNFRIGLDPIIGLIPGIGDFAGAILSGLVLLQAVRLGAAPSTLFVILLNILLDHTIGAVPVLGDLFDAVYKVNRRNFGLLERQITDPAFVRQTSRRTLGVVGWIVGGLFLAILAVMGLMAWGVIAGLLWLFRHIPG